jgi:hypothetical protein
MVQTLMPDLTDRGTSAFVGFSTLTAQTEGRNNARNINGLRSHSHYSTTRSFQVPSA